MFFLFIKNKGVCEGRKSFRLNRPVYVPTKGFFVSGRDTPLRGILCSPAIFGQEFSTFRLVFIWLGARESGHCGTWAPLAYHLCFWARGFPPLRLLNSPYFQKSRSVFFSPRTPPTRPWVKGISNLLFHLPPPWTFAVGTPLWLFEINPPRGGRDCRSNSFANRFER